MPGCVENNRGRSAVSGNICDNAFIVPTRMILAETDFLPHFDNIRFLDRLETFTFLQNSIGDFSIGIREFAVNVSGPAISFHLLLPGHLSIFFCSEVVSFSRPFDDIEVCVFNFFELVVPNNIQRSAVRSSHNQSINLKISFVPFFQQDANNIIPLHKSTFPYSP